MIIVLIVSAIGVSAVLSTRRPSTALAPQMVRDSPSRGNHSSVPIDTSAHESVPVTRPASRDVISAFKSTSDYFEFAKAIATDAARGDAAAAYYLSIALEDCRGFIGMMKGTGRNDPEEALATYQSQFPDGLSQQQREAQRLHLRRCVRFFDSDPLEAFPPEVRQRRTIDWLKVSEEGGNASGAAEYFLRAIPTDAVNEEERARIMQEKVPALLRNAVASKDPRSIAAVGRLLSHPDFSSDPLQGIAWTMAACNLGFDCTTSNRELGLACLHNGTCEPGSTLIDVLRLGLRPDHFAKAYSSAQEIEFGVQSGDSDVLKRFMALKRDAKI